MTAWTGDELTKIATADELEIAPRRDDGTLRERVPIWVVRRYGGTYVDPMVAATAAR
jgi:hypothetical protein